MKKFCHKRGFTFIEVLVSLTILSVGIVAIFQSFIKSMNYMSLLTDRMMVTTLLDETIDLIQKDLNVYNTLPYDVPEENDIELGYKDLEVLKELKISEIDEHVEIFRLDLTMSWQESGKTMKLIRSAYLSDFDYGEL